MTDGSQQTQEQQIELVARIMRLPEHTQFQLLDAILRGIAANGRIWVFASAPARIIE